jgi:hypothetical protein
MNMLIEEMVIFMGYHKMTNVTGVDVCIPAFLPPVLQELMLEYLCGGIHKADEVFVHITSGCAAQEAFHSYVLPNYMHIIQQPTYLNAF